MTINRLSHLIAIVLSSVTLFTQAPLRAAGEPNGYLVSVDGQTYCLAGQKDGSVIVGGNFTQGGYSDIVSTTGGGTTTDGGVYGVAVQNDGKILIWGGFSDVGGTTINRFARLNSNFTLDTSFTPEPNNNVRSVTVQPDGKLIVSGYFTQICGTSTASTVRLNTDGTLDSGFSGPAGVMMSAIEPSGKILVGGPFSTIHSTSKQRFARLNTDGTLDTSFDQTYIDAQPTAILPLSDGKIMVAGTRMVSSTPVHTIARLNADGSLDTSFTAATNPDNVNSMIEQADGKLVYAGWHEVGRLNSDGSVDTSFTVWTPSLGSEYPVTNYGEVRGLIQLANGSYGMAANLTSYNSMDLTYSYLTPPNLLNDPVVTDLKALDGATRLLLTRSGAWAEGRDVVFEKQSGSSWVPLGSATRVTGGWELSGLSFLGTTAQVRALVRAASGSETNGSSYMTTEVNIRKEIDVLPTPYYWSYYFPDTDISGGTSVKTYTIYNRGAFDLTVSNVSIGGTHAGDFSHSSVSLPLVIGPYSSADVVVTFDPSATGTRTATLTITSDDADEAVKNISMSGEGVNPELDIYGNSIAVTHGDTTPSTFDGTQFGNTPHYASTERVFELRNTGSTTLTINSISSSNTASFSFSGYSMYSGPIIILPGNKYDLTVVFWNNGSPYTTEQATITINSNDISESAYTFVVEGTEIAPLLRVKGNNLVIGNGDTTPRPQDHTHFGEVDVLGSGMVTRYFTLENIGIGPLNISAVSLTPSSTSSFILWSLSSSTIAAGSSTTLRVDFDPEMTSADTAVISVLSDSYSGSPHTFTIAGTGRRPQLTVKGNGFTIAQGDYTPASTDHTHFGYVQTGGNLTTSFVLQNTGTSDLWLHTADIYTAGGFTATLTGSPALPLQLAPGASTTWDVTCNPSSAGALTADLVAYWSEDPVYYSSFYHDFRVGGTGVVTGSAASGFTTVTGDATAANTINAAAVQTDGKIIVGGTFTNLNSSSPARAKLARLNTDGSLDTSFTPAVTGTAIEAILIQPDGKIVVGGTFTNIAGASPARVNLARLNSDGTIDSGFTATCTGGAVNSISRQPDGALIVGGAFTTVTGLTQGRLARITTSSTLDTSFLPTVNGIVHSTGVQEDGKVLIAGTFTTVNGATRNSLARLTSLGASDTTFNTNVGTVTAGSLIYTLAIQQDGSILVGGNMLIGTRYRIARYLASGSLDTSFTPGTTSSTTTVESVAVQADGKIVIGGIFTTLAGPTTRRYLARLNANGSLDSYDAALAVTTSPHVNVAQPLLNGRLFVAGTFTPPGSTVKRAALLENGAAAEELVKVGSDIHWYRDGALPEVTNVSFESWNGSSWTAHTGTLSQVSGGGGWQLTSVSPALPSSGKLRAKACYGANGSSSWFTSQESQY